MVFERKLPIPQEVKKMFPLSDALAGVVKERAGELSDIFTGKSSKFILIIGPCSADNPDSVLDYISRLRKIQEEVKDKIFIIPRIYTGKPRTTGDGYKGLLHQPDPNDKPDMFKGIVAIRNLHMRALSEYGFSCADEGRMNPLFVFSSTETASTTTLSNNGLIFMNNLLWSAFCAALSLSSLL